MSFHFLQIRSCGLTDYILIRRSKRIMSVLPHGKLGCQVIG